MTFEESKVAFNRKEIFPPIIDRAAAEGHISPEDTVALRQVVESGNGLMLWGRTERMVSDGTFSDKPVRNLLFRAVSWNNQNVFSSTLGWYPMWKSLADNVVEVMNGGEMTDWV